MPEKGWCLYDFGSDFLDLKVGNGAMSLILLPKYLPYDVFFWCCMNLLLYVCSINMLYACCIFHVIFFALYEMFFFPFFFTPFKNWDQNSPFLMRESSWVGLILQSNWKNVILAGLFCMIADDSFTKNCISLISLPPL